MTFSILTVLVVVESFVILLVFLAYIINRNSKLKKNLEELLRRLSESLFSKLVHEEIDKTVERVQQIEPPKEDDLELSETDIETANKVLKKALTFRSTYLHAEINAYDSSDGDPDLFWHYLAENIILLIPDETLPAEEEPQTNEFIDEIMEELQSKLNKSVESNISLQALLDSLLSNGTLAADQIEIIKKSQADFHDLDQNITDLENKIQNSLNLEITTATEKAGGTRTTESVLIVEKASNVVNTEVNKLKDVIYDQGNKINALLKSLKDGDHSIDADSELSKHLSELEASQSETAMCLEVLEMENHRLMEEIDAMQDNSTAESIDGVDTEEMNPNQLKLKIKALETVIKEKDEQYKKLHNELDSVEHEFMAVYEKANNKD